MVEDPEKRDVEAQAIIGLLSVIRHYQCMREKVSMFKAKYACDCGNTNILTLTVPAKARPVRALCEKCAAPNGPQWTVQLE